MTTPILETERLRLLPLVSADAEQIQRIFPRWEIVRYLIASVPWPYPEGAAQHYVDNVALAASRAGEGWFWTLRRKEDERELMGVICLMNTPDNNRGFWLAPEWQGQGYMRKVLDLAFAEGDRLGVPVILETDAKSKCDKYVHLGMELAGTHDLGTYGKLYDLIRCPRHE